MFFFCFGFDWLVYRNNLCLYDIFIYSFRIFYLGEIFFVYIICIMCVYIFILFSFYFIIWRNILKVFFVSVRDWILGFLYIREVYRYWVVFIIFKIFGNLERIGGLVGMERRRRGLIGVGKRERGLVGVEGVGMGGLW